jgi:glycosyltransferase involved in cell wall biosynthesis
MNKISFVIPVYNEEKSISNTIKSLKKMIKTVGLSYEIIIVNDCSTDKTEDILNSLQDVLIINNTKNLGYGASIKKGIRISKSKYIAIVDADGSYPINEFPKLFKYIDSYDMVVASRDKMGIPTIRKPAKWVITCLANYVSSYKIPDLNSGMRVFNKELALKYWNLYPSRFSLTSTITIAFLNRGYEVKYVPTNYYKREGKSSIHPIKDTIRFLNLVFRLALYFNPLKVFLPISILFFSLAVIRALRDIFSTSDLHVGSFAIILFVISFQIFFFGLLADIINKK